MSLDLESKLSLEADEGAVAAFLDEHGGRLERDKEEPAIYWLTMVPASDPEESYVARFLWSIYPGAAPSVKFASSIDGSLEDSTAWPVVAGFRPESRDICMPITAEGFALHPDWTQTAEAWRSSGNPFLYVVSALQQRMNNQYSGRFGQ